MKKLIPMVILILFLPSVYSVYGGEIWTFHFDECEILTINISGTEEITGGEYTIINECIENQSNNYICKCNNNYDLNITFKINTVNNYTFYFNYNYTKTVSETQPSGGGGGSSKHIDTKNITQWKCTSWTNCQPNNKATRNCTNANNDIKKIEQRNCYFYKDTKKSEQQTIQQPVVKEQEEKKEVISENNTEIDIIPIKIKNKLNYKMLFLGATLLIISIISIISGLIAYNKYKEQDYLKNM